MNIRKLIKVLKTGALPSIAFLVQILFPGCGSDSGGKASKDVGDNNPDLVACIGDSITQGYACVGAPYPERLAAMSGKAVLNFGSTGAKSEQGTSVIGSVVQRKPGYVCILYGSNDAIMSVPPDVTQQHIQYIISVCKANQCVPIVATPPKMILDHAGYDPAAAATAEAVRQAAKNGNATLIDLYKAFGNGEKYLNPDDGLHLSDEGGDFIAKKFNSKL
ncbi:MAG: hypothetical protein GX804_02625 [Lentisphaerae bacterium]|nr:hypothetical protein [Lentisphaerota bacterium]